MFWEEREYMKPFLTKTSIYGKEALLNILRICIKPMEFFEEVFHQDLSKSKPSENKKIDTLDGRIIFQG